jgi:hypothetical protein
LRSPRVIGVGLKPVERDHGYPAAENGRSEVIFELVAHFGTGTSDVLRTKSDFLGHDDTLRSWRSTLLVNPRETADRDLTSGALQGRNRLAHRLAPASQFRWSASQVWRPAGFAAEF